MILNPAEECQKNPVNKMTKERMLSVWKGYDYYASLKRQVTTLAHEMFKVGGSGHVPQLGKIIIDYVGVDFAFKYKPRIALQISARLTVEVATQQILVRLKEANAKLEDTPSATTSASNNTAIVSATQPNRADTVRAHITQIFQLLALTNCRYEASLSDAMMTDSAAAPNTTILFNEVIMRRIGTIFPLNDDIAAMGYSYSFSE